MAVNFEYSTLPPEEPSPRRWGWVIFSIVLVLVLAGGGTYFASRYTLQKVAEIRAVTPPELKPLDPAAQSFAPPTYPPESRTWDQMLEELRPPMEQFWMVDGLRDPLAPNVPAEQWQTFAKAIVARQLLTSECQSFEELNVMAAAMLPHAETHPVIAAAIGYAAGENPGMVPMLEKAYAQLSKQAGQETLAYLVAVNIASLHLGEKSPEDVQSIAFDRVGESLRKSLASDARWGTWPDTLVSNLLAWEQRLTVFRADSGLILAEVTDATSLKPWVKHWITGKAAIQGVLKPGSVGRARKAGAPVTVPPATALKTARVSLEAACKENPQSADPAADLIYSIMMDSAVSDPVKEGRVALDLGTRIEVDHAMSYFIFSSGLKYRNAGSNFAAIKFGQACADTGRFDSFVPYRLPLNHLYDWMEQDRPAGYFEALDFAPFRKVLEGFEGEPKRSAWRDFDRTMAAAISLQCGKFEEASSWLAKLDGRPRKVALENWGGVDADPLVTRTAAFTSRHAQAARDGAQLEEGFLSTPALQLYQKVLADTEGLPPAAVRHFQHRAAAMKLESEFQTRVHLPLKSEPEFYGWSRLGGGWASPADGTGSWVHGERNLASNTVLQARVGQEILLTGEVEFEKIGPYADVWVSLGNPDVTRGEPWMAVRFIKSESSPVMQVTLSKGVDRGASLTPVNLTNGNRFKFVIRTSIDGVTVEVDSRTVWTQIAIPPTVRLDDSSKIGLGARTSTAEGRVRLRDLVIRRQ